VAQKIEELVSRIQELPTLPVVVGRVTQLVNSPDTSASDINEIISQDPALSAKILKLVNSAFYGFPRKISSITHAVVILGFNIIRNLALSTFAFDLFEARGVAFDYQGLWIHSIGCGVTATCIGKHIKFLEPGDLFVGGLLHDIGKVMFAQYLPDPFSKAVNMVEQDSTLLLKDAETQVIGEHHAAMGAYLADRWSLPLHLVEIIGKHHAPETGEETAKPVAIVHLADILTRAMLIGTGGDQGIPEIHPHAIALLEMTEEDFGPIMDQAFVEIRKASAFLDLINE